MRGIRAWIIASLVLIKAGCTSEPVAVTVFVYPATASPIPLPTATPTLTPTPVPTRNPDNHHAGIWQIDRLLNGIVVGKSSEADVVTALGEPDIEEFEHGAIYRYYTDPRSRLHGQAEYSVVFVNDTLAQVNMRASTFLYYADIPHDGIPRLGDFVNVFGEADYVTYSAIEFMGDVEPYTRRLLDPSMATPHPTERTLGQSGYRIVVFLDDGILLRVSVSEIAENSIAAFMVLFEPCSLECVEAQFSSWFWGGKPHPFVPGAPCLDNCGDSLPEDPWGFTNGE
jgi:hypothetical protein